jgi:hypothetical protein
MEGIDCRVPSERGPAEVNLRLIAFSQAVPEDAPEPAGRAASPHQPGSCLAVAEELSSGRRSAGVGAEARTQSVGNHAQR